MVLQSVFERTLWLFYSLATTRAPQFVLCLTIGGVLHSALDSCLVSFAFTISFPIRTKMKYSNSLGIRGKGDRIVTNSNTVHVCKHTCM